MLSVLRELCKNALAAKRPGVVYLHDPILYTSSEKNIFLTIQALDVLAKNVHSPAFHHPNIFYKSTRTLRDEVQLGRLVHMK